MRYSCRQLRSNAAQIGRNRAAEYPWANDFTAELARDARSPEELLYHIEAYNWVLIIKSEKMLKIKTMGRKDAPADVDVPIKELINWLRTGDPESRLFPSR